MYILVQMPIMSYRSILCGVYTHLHTYLIMAHLYRKAFVLDNFPFYSTLLTEIIGRSFQMDLTSDPGIVLLYRVTKVSWLPNLLLFT